MVMGDMVLAEFTLDQSMNITVIKVGTLLLPFITDFIARYRLKRSNYA